MRSRVLVGRKGWVAMRVAVYHDADELERAGGGETDLPDVR